MSLTRDGVAAVRNALLLRVPKYDLDAMRSRLTLVQFVHGQILHEYDEQIEQVFFVEQGMISLVAEADSSRGSGVEVGVVGSEGVVGAVAVLDPAAISFNRAIVQMAGYGLRISAADLRDVVVDSPALREGLGRSLQLIVAQSSQTAACNSRHTLLERCARWLLAAHDRADGDELPLTQEFMAVMLAVRRPGVTLAMGTLQAAGLIQQHRGRVTIIDRAGLEQAACDCHGRLTAFSARLEER